MAAYANDEYKSEPKKDPAPMEVEGPPTVTEEDKSPSIRIWSFSRPHMMAMHLSWLSFFVAFTAWFSVAPLNSVIKKSLHLNKKDILKANFASVTTTVLARLAIGPMTDRYGPKTAQTILLLAGAIPVFCVSQIKTWKDLIYVRGAIGILGATFVPSQAWTTMMFRKNVVGSANAIVGGWGNLGGGFTQWFMVEIYESFLNKGMDKNTAWRKAFMVPGSMLLATAILVYFLGTDTPKGDVRALKKRGYAPTRAAASMTAALAQPATWFLALQYAMSFGVELVVFNMAEIYFHDTFKISVVKAGKVASLGDIGNIFTRAAGGMLSDWWNSRYGMKGRLGVQATLLFFESALLLWFSYAESYKASCILLLAFSVFVQAANGSCFGIVPYVSNKSMGSVSGLVGAGGNIGAMAFSLMFLYADNFETRYGFRVMAYTVFAVACTTFFIKPAESTAMEKPHHVSAGPIDQTAHEDDEETGANVPADARV